MNINEQMDQLGKIGSVGYAPSDETIDQLLTRARRARAVRQGSAAAVGSVSAIALGVLGAQVYVTIQHRHDAATQDRNLIENGLPNIFDFEKQYGSGFNGRDDTDRAAIDKIYQDLNIAAKIEAKHLAEQKAAAAAAAAAAASAKSSSPACTAVDKGDKYKSEATNCEWVYRDTGTSFYDPWLNKNVECVGDKGAEHSGIGYYDCSSKKWVLQAGYFQFGNSEIYKCETWTDAATGATFGGAVSNNPVSGTFNGDWADKRIFCQVGKTYTGTVSSYMYMGSELKSWSNHVCTGSTLTRWGATHRYSCLTESELWDKYGTWSSANGGSHRWTLNNDARKILVDPTDNKWFTPCNQYYNIASPPSGWEWSGTAWVETTPPPPPPDPTPTPDPSPSTA